MGKKKVKRVNKTINNKSFNLKIRLKRNENESYSDENSYSSEFIEKKEEPTEPIMKIPKQALEKRYVCEICFKIYKNSIGLKYHMASHTGEKPYECSVCKKCFSQPSSLKVHERIHTGENPYECEFCEKTFRDKNGFNVHTRKHTGEKPYKCFICNKEFAQLNVLTTHELTHTGGKPFECDQCEKSFTTSGNLKLHMKVHKIHCVTRKPKSAEEKLKTVTRPRGRPVKKSGKSKKTGPKFGSKQI